MKLYFRKIINNSSKEIKHNFFDKRNNLITDQNYIESLLGVYIAPAYDDVKINLNKNAKILAIGYDNKMRPQYIYNKKFVEKMKKKSFMIYIYLDYNIIKL